MTAIMEPCPKGHTDWYYPPSGAKCTPYCRVCKRESRGIERVPCTHEGVCEETVNKRGRRYCRAQAKHGQRLARRLGDARPTRRERTAQAKAIQRPDGLEDVYGPVPARVPDRIWVDRVALELTLDGKRVGRRLTRGEKRALELLRVLRHSNRRYALSTTVR